MHYTVSNPMRGANAVQGLTRITSFVSILGCSAVARRCWELRRQKKLTHMDKLVLVLCLVDLGLAIAWFIGNWPRRNAFACNFQVRLKKSTGIHLSVDKPVPFNHAKCN